MTEVIVFPNVEQAIRLALLDDLPAPWTTLRVVGQVPNPRPASFLLVRRDGGPRRSLVVDGALCTVESWAATKQAAHDLAAHVRGLLGSYVNRSTDSGLIYGVGEAGGPQWFPDPESASPRYVQAFQVTTRGTPAA